MKLLKIFSLFFALLLFIFIGSEYIYNKSILTHESIKHSYCQFYELSKLLNDEFVKNGKYLSQDEWMGAYAEFLKQVTDICRVKFTFTAEGEVYDYTGARYYYLCTSQNSMQLQRDVSSCQNCGDSKAFQFIQGARVN